MKLNKTTLMACMITLVIGMGAGAYFFGGDTTKPSEAITEHDHSNETGAWTCSMHPQVRQSEPGACPFCGMDLIPVTEEESAGPTALKMTEEAIALANIQTSEVVSMKHGKQLVLNGRLTYDERLKHSQTTHFGGRIEELYKNFEGETVRKGQVLAAIYSPELLAAQEELLQALRVAEDNPSLVISARNKLKYWKLTEEQIAKIEKEGEPIEKFPLLAQYNGIISKKMVNNGDHIKEGQTLFEISDPNRLWAIFEVYEKDFDQIQLGSSITFKPNGSPRDFEAEISFISPEVDPIRRVIEIRANINNRDKLLKADMFIDGQLENVNANEEVMAIPRSAILWTGRKSIVYVKRPNELIFELREVTLGSNFGDQTIVLSGLMAGEEVVTNGAFTLDAEAQLQGKISMMNTNGESVVSKTFTEIKLSQFKDFQNETPQLFKQQLNTLALSYIALKDEMVTGESDLILQKAEEVANSLDQIDMSLLKGDAHMHWMEILEAMDTSLDQIIAASNRDLQRLEFINLSKATINAIQSFGVDNDSPLYVQYCPMANDSQGANWLSLNENIINPYFGDMMLTCGNVEQILNN